MATSSISNPADATRHARTQLQLLADISSPAIAYLNIEHQFEITNEAFKTRFGNPDSSTTAGDFFQGVCSPTVDRYVQRTIDRRASLSGQLDCTNCSGDTERLAVDIVPHFAPEEVHGVFLMFQNVETRSVDIESDDDGDDRTTQLHRMAELGEMMAGAIHELRQPLSAIRNYASALSRLAQPSDDNTQADELARHIVQQAKRADTILTAARDTIRQDQEPDRWFCIRQVVDDSIEMVERRARQLDVDVRRSTYSDLPQIKGNSLHVEQILVNLLTNALDAMADCSKRVLLVDVETADNGAIRVYIRDTGDGLSEDVANSLFQAFKTTKNSGMGLGLSISRALAERQGGRLWAETELPHGYGAGFVLELPGTETADSAAG